MNVIWLTEEINKILYEIDIVRLKHYPNDEYHSEAKKIAYEIYSKVDKLSLEQIANICYEVFYEQFCTGEDGGGNLFAMPPAECNSLIGKIEDHRLIAEKILKLNN